MSQFVETNTKTFVPGAAIPQYARVKGVSGKLQLAGVGASDEPVELGTVEEDCFGDVNPPQVAVRLRSASGTRKAIAAGAAAQFAAVYGAANGRVSTTSSGPQLGIFLEAAGAAGDIVEVMYF